MTDKAWVRLMDIGRRFNCHQMPERSLFINGRQCPLCARCTGVLLGNLAAICLFFIRPLPFVFIALGAMPMGIDWLLQRLNIKPSTNKRRLITGAIGGYALTNLHITLFLRLMRFIF